MLISQDIEAPSSQPELGFLNNLRIELDGMVLPSAIGFMAAVLAARTHDISRQGQIVGGLGLAVASVRAIRASR